MYVSRPHPKAASHSLYVQCPAGIIPNRPDRLSVNPVWTSSGEEPRSMTCSNLLCRESSSQSILTTLDQPGIFCTSSMTSTPPFLPVFSLPISHCCSIHVVPCNVGPFADL